MDFVKMINDRDFEDYSPYSSIDIEEDLHLLKDLLEYAIKQNYHTLDELDNDGICASSFVEMFDFRVSNTNIAKPDLEDLTPIKEVYDQLIDVLSEDESLLDYICQKTALLFKLRKNDEAEAYMMEYIRKYPNVGRAYLDLALDFDGIARKKQEAIYYLKLALKQENLSDREEIEDYLEDLEA